MAPAMYSADGGLSFLNDDIFHDKSNRFFSAMWGSEQSMAFLSEPGFRTLIFLSWALWASYMRSEAEIILAECAGRGQP